MKNIEDTETLHRQLEELVTLLDEFEVINWRDYFIRAKTEFDSDPIKGARWVLGAYGGMGSFNDCTLPFHKPRTPKDLRLSEKRIRFNELSESIYALADQLARST